MRPPLIRQGGGPQALAAIYESLVRHRRELEQMIATANATESEQELRRRGIIAGRSAAGDELRLRGIPVAMRGVPGVMPGTKPGALL